VHGPAHARVSGHSRACSSLNRVTGTNAADWRSSSCSLCLVASAPL
jgi:hypothetical protein